MENNKKTVTIKHNRFWLVMHTYLHHVSTWYHWMWSWKQMHTQDFTGSSTLLSGLIVYDSFKQSHCTSIISIAAMNYQRIPDFTYFLWCQLKTPIKHMFHLRSQCRFIGDRYLWSCVKSGSEDASELNKKEGCGYFVLFVMTMREEPLDH